jgi:hypothetical protein
MLSVLGLDCSSEGDDIEEKFVEQELLDEPDEEEAGPDETPPAISEVGWKPRVGTSGSLGPQMRLRRAPRGRPALAARAEPQAPERILPMVAKYAFKAGGGSTIVSQML